MEALTKDDVVIPDGELPELKEARGAINFHVIVDDKGEMRINFDQSDYTQMIAAQTMIEYIDVLSKSKHADMKFKLNMGKARWFAQRMLEAKAHVVRMKIMQEVAQQEKTETANPATP